MMPYQDFRNFTDEDLASVVVYLRSLQPIHNPLPKMQIPFPLSRLINGVPQPVKEPVTADTSGPVSRGRYLATVGHLHQLPYAERQTR